MSEPPTQKFSLTRLAVANLETVMHWRMLPHVTQYMNTDPELTLEGQKLWFEKLSSAGENFYWVINVEDTPCGVINFADIDFENKHCTWGYYIAEKELRSLPLAIALEMSLYDYAFDTLKLNKVTGESFCLNTAAVTMHELCGCKSDGILRQHVLKKEQFYDVCVQSMLKEEWYSLRDDFEYQHLDFSK